MSEALLDADKMDELIRIWERANHGSDTDRRVILAVDAMSFRSPVVITEDGTIEGLLDPIPSKPRSFHSVCC
jgi:hypothetical protein